MPSLVENPVAWLLGAVAGGFGGLILAGFIWSVARELKVLAGAGPLSRERAHLAWGTMLFVTRLLYCCALLAAVAWQSDWLPQAAGIALLVVCVGLAALLRAVGVRRMRSSLREGGFGPIDLADP